MTGSVRRWMALSASGAMLGAMLAFGSVTVSADADTVQPLGQTECTRTGQCPKPDEFRAGDADSAANGAADTTSDTSGSDTNTPDNSGGQAPG
jgi:hypothetical protein